MSARPPSTPLVRRGAYGGGDGGEWDQRSSAIQPLGGEREAPPPPASTKERVGPTPTPGRGGITAPIGFSAGGRLLVCTAIFTSEQDGGKTSYQLIRVGSVGESKREKNPPPPPPPPPPETAPELLTAVQRRDCPGSRRGPPPLGWGGVRRGPSVPPPVFFDLRPVGPLKVVLTRLGPERNGPRAQGRSATVFSFAMPQGAWFIRRQSQPSASPDPPFLFARQTTFTVPRGNRCPLAYHH